MKAHHDRTANWKNWGPYLSERSWSTVREDYSPNGDTWNYFPYAHAKSRSYRWNEDGLAGICNRYQHHCFALSLWNEQDESLKERLFGVNQEEGNHGEDVKEYYFYLDSTPTHSYMKMLYKYPQNAFPYQKIIFENQKRTALEKEYELEETAIFHDGSYFDIYVEYAKADCNDLLIEVTAVNAGTRAAPLHLLPTVWFRNSWSWGYQAGPMGDTPQKPQLHLCQDQSIEMRHPTEPTYFFYAKENKEWLFTENETNQALLFGTPNAGPYVKDAFHRYLVEKEQKAINPAQVGTKCAAHFYKLVQPQEVWKIQLRLSEKKQTAPFKNFDEIFITRKKEADLFYKELHASHLTQEEKKIQREALSSLLWSKQIYYYDLEQWLHGDPIHPVERQISRNKSWIHLTNFDVISMPDKWEYPWYASWDLCFHAIALVMVDADFAKRQLTLITREWYMHPNGQLPAYEWNFSDVNPPVLAWAAWRVYKIDYKLNGKKDVEFLERLFHKLLLNFTWWVNQKDLFGNNVFQGGFLGLDNISIFDRSNLAIEGHIDQADGTAWMGFYCTLMMKISIELSRTNSNYQDCATKFFEHYLRIASAMILPESKGYALWNEEDGFFYDVLHIDKESIPLRIRSMVGLLPLFAVETIEQVILKSMPVFKRRMKWFLNQRANYASMMTHTEDVEQGPIYLMSILSKERLISTLRYLCDENEFLSPYGIRSLSKFHQDNPYYLKIEEKEYWIRYEPGDSEHREMAGGNSNWRGPIWLPLNYLIIESLEKYHHYYQDRLKVEFPTGSGVFMNLGQVAQELSNRLLKLFKKNQQGKRAIFAENSLFNQDEKWQDLLLFHEFFHGETGEGLGASHQTGWTALIAKILQKKEH